MVAGQVHLLPIGRKQMVEEEEEKSVIHYFVDEAGDPTLFNRKGRIITGNDGCSGYFILGKLDIGDPDGLARELNALRAELLADPYFKDVPSMQSKNRKTALAFHAKDDLPEVRREVFKLLLRQDVRFYAVVRNKQDLAAYVQQQNERDATYRYNQNEQYDLLLKELFRKLHHMAEQVNICFAKRGNKSRNQALRNALEKAENAFMEDFGFSHPANNDIISSTAPQICWFAGGGLLLVGVTAILRAPGGTIPGDDLATGWRGS